MTKPYPAAFKARAVPLAVESAQPLAQTACDLGVHDNTWPTWSGHSHRVERQAQQGQDAPVAEARKRRRQAHARCKEERARLKKAAASGAPPRPCRTPGGKSRPGRLPAVVSVGRWQARVVVPTRGAAAGAGWPRRGGAVKRGGNAKRRGSQSRPRRALQPSARGS
jgi:transposase-like protein